MFIIHQASASAPLETNEPVTMFGRGHSLFFFFRLDLLIDRKQFKVQRDIDIKALMMDSVLFVFKPCSFRASGRNHTDGAGEPRSEVEVTGLYRGLSAEGGATWKAGTESSAGPRHCPTLPG